jgi:hypothetical protein
MRSIVRSPKASGYGFGKLGSQREPDAVERGAAAQGGEKRLTKRGYNLLRAWRAHWSSTNSAFFGRNISDCLVTAEMTATVGVNGQPFAQRMLGSGVRLTGTGVPKSLLTVVHFEADSARTPCPWVALPGRLSESPRVPLTCKSRLGTGTRCVPIPSAATSCDRPGQRPLSARSIGQEIIASPDRSPSRLLALAPAKNGNNCLQTQCR